MQRIEWEPRDYDKKVCLTKMKTEVSFGVFIKLTFNQMKTVHSTEQTSKDTDIYIKLVTAQMRNVGVMLMSFDDKSEFMEPVY